MNKLTQILLILMGVAVVLLVYSAMAIEIKNKSLIINHEPLECIGIYIGYPKGMILTQEYVYDQLKTFSNSPFPLTVELKGECSVHIKRVYYAISELPTKNVCVDERNCLWKFEEKTKCV